MAYANAWRDRVAAPRRAVSDTVPDGQHSAADPLYGERHQDWNVEGARLGVLPAAVLDESQTWTVDSSLPALDRTPEDHDDGQGVSAGLPERESMRRNAANRRRDEGHIAGRLYAHPPAKDWVHHADLFSDPPKVVGSPEQHRIQDHHNDPEFGPDNRTGRMVRRWTDRHFAMRWFVTDHSPLTYPTAYTGKDAPAAPQGGPYVSPFSTQAPINVVRSVLPQRRRTPPSQTDGGALPTDQNPAGYAFQSWGSG